MDKFFESLEHELQDLMAPEDQNQVKPKARNDPSKFDQFISTGPEDLMTPNDSIELLQKDLDNTLDMLNLLDNHEQALEEAVKPVEKPVNDFLLSLYPMKMERNGIIKVDGYERILSITNDIIQKIALKMFIHHPHTQAKSLIVNQFTTSFYVISYLIEKCSLSWDGFIEGVTKNSFYNLSSTKLGWTLVEIQQDMFRPIMNYEYIQHVIASWDISDGHLWLLPIKSSDIYADFHSLIKGYPKMVGFLTIELHSTLQSPHQATNKKRMSMFRSPSSKQKKSYRYYCQVTLNGLLIKFEKDKERKYLWQDYNLFSQMNQLLEVCPDFKHKGEPQKKICFILMRKATADSNLVDKLICYVEGSEKLRDWTRSIQSAIVLWSLYQNPEWFFDCKEYSLILENNESTALAINRDELVTIEEDVVVIKQDLSTICLRRSFVQIMNFIDKKHKKSRKSRGISQINRQMNASMPSIALLRNDSRQSTLVTQSQNMSMINVSTPKNDLNRSKSTSLYDTVDTQLKQRITQQYPGLKNDGPYIQMEAPPMPTSTLYDQVERKKKRPTSLSSGTLYDAIQKHQKPEEPYHKI